jgi:hypothetical protein
VTYEASALTDLEILLLLPICWNQGSPLLDLAGAKLPVLIGGVKVGIERDISCR